MDMQTFGLLGWAVVFAAVGAVAGILLVLLAATYVPRLLNKVTPNIDEGREIARGNVAVAEYFGRVCAAAIIGLSLVVSAAILGAMIAVFR